MRRTGCSVTAVARSGVRQMSSSEYRWRSFAILAHVAAGLSHEPHRRRVNRLASAGLEESAFEVAGSIRSGQSPSVEVASEPDQIFEPQRLEAQLGAQLAQLVGDGIVKEIVARDDGDRRGRDALTVLRAEPSQESETIDERHAQVEDDRVGVAFSCDTQSRFSIKGRPDLKAFESQHARERLCHALIVVHDEDGGSLWVGLDGLHSWLF